MNLRSRILASVVLSLAVALPLLPTALDDDLDERSADDEDVDAEVADRGDGARDPETGGAVDQEPSPTDNTTTTSLRPDEDGDSEPDQSTPTTASSTTRPVPTTTGSTGTGGDVGGGPPATAPPVGSPVGITLGTVGDLVTGRQGSIVVAVAANTTASRTVTLTLDVQGAVVTEVPPGCVNTVLTAVCTVTVAAGSTTSLVVGLAVDAAADNVSVTANVVVGGAPDPAAVRARFPTDDPAGGLAARAAVFGSYDVTVVGNTLLSCPDGATVGAVACEDVRAGVVASAATNDAWPMAVVRADARGTGSSSAAELRLGGQRVERAFLVWAASAAGTTPAGAGSIRLATPARGGGSPAADSDYDIVVADETIAAAGAWQSVADVTASVVAGGDGTYWVADVASAPGGSDAWAGWSLVVVHSAATAGDVVVLDGLVDLTAAEVVAPLPTSTATVTPEVSLVTWDGDAGVVGEVIGLREVDGGVAQVYPFGDALNPPDDVANSTVSRSGAAVGDRLPAHANTLGVDVDQFDGASLESSELAFAASSTGDDVFVGVVAVRLRR